MAASTLTLAAADYKWQAIATADLIQQQSQRTQDHLAQLVLQETEWAQQHREYLLMKEFQTLKTDTTDHQAQALLHQQDHHRLQNASHTPLLTATVRFVQVQNT